MIDQSVESTTVRLFHQSNIDYPKYYLLLFASFNSWYRATTGESNDALALRLLQKHVSVWYKLLGDDTPQSMLSIVRKMYILSQHRAVEGASKVQWSGRLSDPYDWRGVVWLWYTIRCQLVHGDAIVNSVLGDVYLRYAYESLRIFMQEIVNQMMGCGDEYLKT